MRRNRRDRGEENETKYRVIELHEYGELRWYWLHPDAPPEIRDRDELIRWSLRRTKPSFYGQVEIEVREDLCPG